MAVDPKPSTEPSRVMNEGIENDRNLISHTQDDHKDSDAMHIAVDPRPSTEPSRAMNEGTKNDRNLISHTQDDHKDSDAMHIAVDPRPSTEPSRAMNREDNIESSTSDPCYTDMNDHEMETQTFVSNTELEDKEEIAGGLTLQRQLDIMATSSVFERIELWHDCCNFFNVSPDRTDSKNKFSIYGFKRSLMPHQLLCIYWMLLQERSDSHGGFLCDEQGLGKTFELGGLIIVNSILVDTHRRVEDSRACRDGKHLLSEPQDSNATCPTQEVNHIACPCVNSHKSSGIMPVFGPSLIFVPPPLVKNWIDELNNTIHENQDIKLIVAYRFFTTEYSISNNNELLFKDSEGNAKPGSEKFIVLTTSQSFDNYVHKPTTKDIVKYIIEPPTGRQKKPRKVPQFETLHHVLWARVIVDEFHKEKRETATIPNRLSSKLFFHFLWAASGTPFEQGPRDLIGYIIAMEKKWPSGNKDLQKCTSHTAISVHKELESIRRKSSEYEIMDEATRATAESATAKFSHILQMLIIRRTTGSKWFGQPILPLKPLQRRDINIAMNPGDVQMLNALFDDAKLKLESQFEERLSVWRQRGCRGERPKPSSNVWFTSARHARILATFPYLKKLLDSDTVDLTWDQVTREGWVSNSSPYSEHLSRIINSSQKMTRIRNILQEMQIPEDDTQVISANDRKVIIFSEHPVVSFLIHLDLTRTYGEAVALFWANPDLKHRQALWSRFQENDPDAGGPLRILVGNIRILGIGFTLTKADTVVLVEPQWLEGDEKQAIARVQRISQVAPKCYAYRLFCADVLVEKMIIQRHLFRQMINEMSTTVTRPENNKRVENGEAIGTGNEQPVIEIDS